MKILKLFIPVTMLMMVYSTAKAGNSDEGMLTKTHAINTYVDAVTRGKMDGLADVIDQSAKFTVMQGKHLNSYTKKQMIDFLSTVKNIEMDCTTNTAVFESNANITIIKVDMQFNGFMRSNYVTIANTGNGWKIINVYSILT